MGTEGKVAIVTGGSQGIGAALVEAYRAVATARSIKQTDDVNIAAVSGDIGERQRRCGDQHADASVRDP